MRNRPRKTTIGTTPEEVMRNALKAVKEGQSCRAAAKYFGIARQTLQRYVKKTQDNDENVRLVPNYVVRRVFSDEQENALEEYLLTCSKMMYGLTVTDFRRLAYEMAIANAITVPALWHDMTMAGIEWYKCFMKRHSGLSLRTPEGCSLSRATSFNRHNTDAFYNNLDAIYKRLPSLTANGGSRIFNYDETGVTTVQQSPKIITKRGQKQVSKATSGEKGTLVTVGCFISASGGFIPPVMVFPRVHFKEHMTRGAPEDTLGLANQSGWMNEILFVEVMRHFVAHTRSTREDPVLLIYDNHESHLSIDVLDLAKANGVTILTLPPHSSHKMQPLDVSVYGPFDKYYHAAVDSWMMANPGQTFNIYEVAACVGYAHAKALTPTNILSAFKCTGIYPFDRNVFTDADFLASAVTDRPEPENSTDIPTTSGIQMNQTDNSSPSTTDTPPTSFPEVSNIVASGSGDPAPAEDRPTTTTFVSPRDFRGLPKAPPRKTARRGRQKGRSMIATDTPEKTALEERKRKKVPKKDHPRARRGNNASANASNTCRSPKPTRRQLFPDDSMDESSHESYTQEESDSDIALTELIDVDNYDPQKEPQEGDYVLVKYNVTNKKDKPIYYVGKVVDKSGVDYVVDFMRASTKLASKFMFPDVKDTCLVAPTQIECVLPEPTQSDATKRQKAYLSFSVSFDDKDVRLGTCSYDM